MVAIRLENLSKSFGSVKAVDGVTLDIPEGELFFLLGPSGCGKTTVLRSIAGFETPDGGRILFDGKDVTEVPPYKRNSGMVFQNYALWPHMSVFENVAYGLRVRGLSKEAIAQKVGDALAMVKMTRERDRYPNQLSGGQQQRVALARALVIEPGCLLLDEPLSNLDAKLRLEMREEIRRIHSETGVTTVYVTHDQKEALSMAHRLAVLMDGRVIQDGTPGEVYRRPRNVFVAAFIGETNLFDGHVAGVGGEGVLVETVAGAVRGTVSPYWKGKVEGRCSVSIRPEDIKVFAEAHGGGGVEGRVISYTFLGEVGQYVLDVGGKEVKALVVAPLDEHAVGEAVRLGFPVEKSMIFPAGEALSDGAA